MVQAAIVDIRDDVSIFGDAAHADGGYKVTSAIADVVGHQDVGSAILEDEDVRNASFAEVCCANGIRKIASDDCDVCAIRHKYRPNSP